MKWLPLFLLTAIGAQGAQLWVKTSGSDGNPGTFASPWATLTHGFASVSPGDTLNVDAGDYPEYVDTTVNGRSGRITVISTNGASLRGLVISSGHAGYTISGLTIKYFSDANNAGGVANQGAIRIEPGADNAIITGCTIRDTPYVITNDFTFDSTTNLIHTSGGDFVAAGFVPGSHVFLGSVSTATYTNHDTGWQVKALDAHNMWVTNQFGTNFVSDPGTGYTALIVAGDAGTRADNGIYVVNSGFNSATNVTIAGNTVSNTVGNALNIAGGGPFLIAFNDIQGLKGFNWLSFNSCNTHATSNYVHDLISPWWFAGFELSDTNLHPLGATLYDYHDAHSQHQSGTSTNNLFDWNYFVNWDNAGMTSQSGANRDLSMIHNIIVGVSGNFSWHVVGTFVGNTCYKDSWDELEKTVLIASTAPGMVVMSNIFAACGNHANLAAEGYYDMPPGTTTNYNFVCGPEVTGWARKSPFSEPNGVNGGDPTFVNVNSILGPDGKIWTADDGLRPLPYSVAGQLGLGALAPVPDAGLPIAHFTLISPIGWSEVTGTNYDPAWIAKTPLLRGHREREWYTVDSITNMPVTAVFSASNSFDGVNPSNHNDLYWAAWSWGDGATDLEFVRGMTNIIQSHLYTTTGTFPVTLTITNRLGASSTYSNLYRIQAKGGAFAGTLYTVETTGNDSNNGTTAPFATVGKAATVVNAGDMVTVGPGTYAAYVDLTRAAASNNPITWVSRGATNWGFNIRNGDQVFDGWHHLGFGTNGQGTAVYYVYANANRVQIRNAEIGSVTNLHSIQFNAFSGTNDPTQSPSWCSVSNVTMHHCWSGQPGAWTNGNSPFFFVMSGRSNVVSRNISYLNNGQADFIRPNGQGHRILYNYTDLNSQIQENHTDFVQLDQPGATSNAYYFCQDILLQGNWIRASTTNSHGSVCEIQTTYLTNAPTMVTNIMFVGNIFEGLDVGASTSADGVKWYNNDFIRCLIQVGAPSGIIVGGGSSGSCWGMDIKNNIFFQCCTNAGGGTVGWYDARADSRATNSFGNGSIDADYDFVCGTNYAGKSVAGANDFQHWKALGWESHGINGGNPQFVDDTTNWHLQNSSPLYQAGVVTAYTPATDYDGNAWVGGLPSIGAFQAGISGGALPPTGLSIAIRGSVVIKGRVYAR